MAAYIESRQIQHKGIVLEKILEDENYKIQDQKLIIQALINLLISKNILRENEVDEMIDSIKVMDKLTEN